MSGRRRVLKKTITWLAVLFVVFYLVTQPTSAGHLITSAFHGLGDAGRSLATFVNSLSL
jgi:preprotein translocase subunit SecG